MKVSYALLKERIPGLTISPQEVADKLTMKSYEVEEVVRQGASLDGVVVGEIVQILAHPNADKLQIALVDVGVLSPEPLKIVCGAPNIAVGQKVPVAMIGTTLPNCLTIKKSKIRGESSNGMLCSAEELKLNTDSNGILILDRQSQVGEMLASSLGMQDTVIEIANKSMGGRASDSLSVWGVARELSQMLGLDYLEFDLQQVPEYQSKTIIRDESICSRYMTLEVKNISHIFLSEDLIRTLETLGHTSINHLVDLGNLVMEEIGQPLHIFNADALAGNEIIIRKAKDGEVFVALDGQKYLLEAGDIVICDAEKIIALAGIKGALNSAVDNDTKNILVESANFDSVQISKTARRLKLMSDASRRFEKGIPLELAEIGLKRFAYHIRKLGYNVSGMGSVGDNLSPSHSIELEYEYVYRYLGTTLNQETVDDILSSIGCILTDKTDQSVIVTAPFYRLDMLTPEDVLEDIARVYGYERILPKTDFSYQRPTSVREFTNDRKVKETLAHIGFTEVHTYPYTKQGEIKMLNPVDTQKPYLRTNLTLHMVEVMDTNRYSFEKFKVFEVAHVFETKGESTHAVWGVYDKHTNLPTRNQEAMQVLGVLLYQLGYQIHLELMPTNEDLVPIMYQTEPIGFLDRGNAIVEISLTKLYASGHEISEQYVTTPKYPVVKRDITIEVPSDKMSWHVYTALRQSVPKTCEKVLFKDIYHKEHLKALTFHLLFRSEDSSLSDEQVNEWMRSIEKKVGKSLAKE